MYAIDYGIFLASQVSTDNTSIIWTAIFFFANLLASYRPIAISTVLLSSVDMVWLMLYNNFIKPPDLFNFVLPETGTKIVYC